MRRILAVVLPMLILTSGCNSAPEPTVTPSPTAGDSKVTFTADTCTITVDEALTGVTSVSDVGKNYVIADWTESFNYTSAVVVVGRISCPRDNIVDSFYAAKLDLSRTAEAQSEAEKGGDGPFIVVPRSGIIAPYTRPFGTTGDFGQNSWHDALDGAPFWMVFGLRDGETPVALISENRERVPLGELMKPSASPEWTTPRLTSWPPK